MTVTLSFVHPSLMQPVALSFRFLLFSLATMSAAGASAQALPAGVRLGMTADDLRVAAPDVARVARPARLAGGLAGTWRGAPSPIWGLAFEPTYFFAGNVLQRVEWMRAADDLADRGAGAFAELLQWGRAQFGAETASRDPGSAYASWSTDDTDIYLQHVDGAGHATVRLVYKTRQRKDASML